MSKLLFTAEKPIARLLLAHGAGASSQHEFMQLLAEKISQLNVEVQLFDFEYMQLMLKTEKRRPPDRLPKLINYFTEQVNNIGSDLPLFIAGKSMGGRVATHLNTMAELSSNIKGVCAYGYPFHPPGKPEKLRVEHFQSMLKPCLILQGERDTFGNVSEVAAYDLSAAIKLIWLADGDHSFKPRKKSGLTQREHIQTAAEITVDFIQKTLAEV